MLIKTSRTISIDKTNGNPITDIGATLGRTLFYDKNPRCQRHDFHLQEFAFGDTAIASVGVDGTTGRHSMRLINSRFSDEERFRLIDEM